MRQIGILGAGGWGVALARSLARNSCQVRLWEIDPRAASELIASRELNAKLPEVKLPDSVEVFSDMARAVEGLEAVLVVVPSRFYEDTLRSLKQSGWPFRPDSLLGVATKGLLYPGGKRLSRAAKEILPEAECVIITGPSHAEEVGRDMPTALVAASGSQKAAEAIQKCLMTERLRVYTSRDVIGVEIGGALKNVLAIASGISDGMGFGDNSRAALITRGLREIIALGSALGGREETFMGLTGLGDLVVTCTSRHSRNRRLGEWIGQGIPLEKALERMEMVAEGYYTAKNIAELEQNYNLELPICREVYKILYEGKSPSLAVNDLMLRERKAEIVISKERPRP